MNNLSLNGDVLEASLSELSHSLWHLPLVFLLTWPKCRVFMAPFLLVSLLLFLANKYTDFWSNSANDSSKYGHYCRNCSGNDAMSMLYLILMVFLLVGLMQIGLGFLGLEKYIKYMPYPSFWLHDCYWGHHSLINTSFSWV